MSFSYSSTFILILSLLILVDSRISASALDPKIMQVLNLINTISANQTVTVGDTGNFRSITEAVKYAETKDQEGYFMIKINEGVYHEKVKIQTNKLRLIIIGAGINRTIITGNQKVRDGLRTYDTATFAVESTGFIACNLTFENTAGPCNGQAVAVRNQGDYSVFYRCSFLGYQDTLYVYKHHQFYRECDVYGTVDFIFGNAAAVFQNCGIYARKPYLDQPNVITAQSRKSLVEQTCISFHNCSILAAPDLDTNLTKTYLGRPWRIYSTTVFMQSYIGSHIDPKGWLEWNGSVVGLDTLYSGEYGNYGPGSSTTGRVTWPGYKKMNRSDADNFTVSKFISGQSWLTNTSIPFIPGLL